MLEKTVSKGTDDAYYMLEAKREADSDYLSKADIEALDCSIAETEPFLMGSCVQNRMVKNGAVPISKQDAK